jgi:beta-1,4-mannosyltransferase
MINMMNQSAGSTDLSKAESQLRTAPLTVAFISSSWYGNPYEDLLIESLGDQGVTVRSYFRTPFFLFKILRDGKPNLLHLQTLHYLFVSRNRLYFWFKFWLFIAQLYILRWMGVQTLWTVHEWADKISDGQHNLPVLQAKMIGKALSGLITHCDSSNREMVADLKIAPQDAEKVFTIPHASYIGAYANDMSKAEARQRLGLGADEIIFLLFGGIHHSKGALEAVETFRTLAPGTARLIIAGKPAHSSLREAILEQSHGCDSVLFVDSQAAIPDDQVQLYMNACDVVMLPYKIFTTSGVALLAMSFARPCIAPNAGFFKDTFDADGAFLYDPTAPGSLLSAVQHAIANQDQLAQMGQHNHDIVAHQSWDFVARKTVEAYRWCLS